jgi:hypothetical protein
MGFFSDELTQTKLALLYFFDTADFVLPAEQIARIGLELGMDDYFTLKQSLLELSESRLLAVVNRPVGECYCLSAQGKEVVSQFSPRLPLSLRKDIDSYVKENRRRILGENIASYQRLRPGQFAVTCRILEGDLELMRITLNVVSSEHAAAICRRWEDRAQDVYKSTLDLLTPDR